MIYGEDEYSYPVHMIGQAHFVSSDDRGRDPVAELRAVVAEVTGKPCDAQMRRIGFLP